MPAFSKGRVNRAGERIRANKESGEDLDLVREYRALRANSARSLLDAISPCSVAHQAFLSFRIKRVDTIIQKLRTHPTSMDLTRMNDILAYRAICASRVSQNSILDCLIGAFDQRIKGVTDYLSQGREDGYRASHVIVRDDVRPADGQSGLEFTVEIQVRTYFQHLWATLSESFGEHAKAGGGTEAQRRTLSVISDHIRKWEDANPDVRQIDAVPGSSHGSICTEVKTFDKNMGALINAWSFKDDITGALELYGSLETAQTDRSKEVVLVGSNSNGDDLKITHLRYVSPQGVPEFPPELGVIFGGGLPKLADLIRARLPS